MAMVKKSLGDILVEKNLLSREKLAEAQAAQRATPSVDLGTILVQLQFAAEVDVYRAKAEADGIPFIDLTKHKPEPSAISVVPEHIVKKHNALPVRKDNQTLFVAMVDPRNVVAVDDIRMVSRCMVRPMAAVPSD